MDRVRIIAEAGVNHNGDVGMAKQLIDVAADAGADYVKFQTFNADRQVTRDARKARYQVNANDVSETQYQMLKDLEISSSMHEVLIDHCRKRNINFLSTGFDIESVDLLHSLGLRLFKIPSGEITNLPYLRHVGRLGCEVILSSGMASLGEIEAALDSLEKSGLGRGQVTVLHCTTEYPAPFAEVNLNVLSALRVSLGTRVGYSDHTTGMEVSIAATALGTTVIEKHITLNRCLPGPDHAASLEPQELKSLVASIRHIELALGSSVKRRTPSEVANAVVARKSIVASRAIHAGELFSAENLTTKRPGNGISPMRWDEVLGCRAPHDFQPDEFIFLS